MKKISIQVELLDDWDEALKKEYEMTKEVLQRHFEYEDSYEEFIALLINEILLSETVYNYLDSFIESHKERVDAMLKQKEEQYKKN